MAHKILIGACVRQDSVVLQYYLQSLRSLLLPKGVEAAFGFVNDGGPEQLEQLAAIQPAVVLPAESRPADALYSISQQTHLWNVSTFEHLARQKQRLLQYAIDAGYSHVFLVDSDLLLEPTTLLNLWPNQQTITNAVFWTRWQQGAPAQPQCWLQHPYGFRGLGMEEHDFIARLVERQVIRCIGGGACTLIPMQALKRGVRYHPRIASLPQEGMWQGEDRTFALHASSLHIRQLADGWADVFHAYHPEQREGEVLAEAWSILNAPRQQQANYGDQISLLIEPLEDRQLVASLELEPEMRCVRGRLGGLRLAPEIEAKVLEMHPGDSAMLDVRFPSWSELQHYRNQHRMLRLTLLDCKPYSAAPTLAEDVFAGVGQ